MKLNPVSEWFGPKAAGFGFEPKTWEGMGITLLTVLLMLGLPILLGARPQGGTVHPVSRSACWSERFA